LKGLPGLKGIGDKLVPIANYQQKLYSKARDKSKFSAIKDSITRKAFMEDLEFDLLIRAEIKHLFMVKPTFHKYTEVDETYKKLVKMPIPYEDRWDHLCQILE